MAHVFQKHYTRDEARALLPLIRDWLNRLSALRKRVLPSEQNFAGLLQQGCDLGGPAVNLWIRQLLEMRELLTEFHTRQIQIKDLERGLIDFPAIVDGREVFLCWEQDEEDIAFWHDLDAGYAGREKL